MRFPFVSNEAEQPLSAQTRVFPQTAEIAVLNPAIRAANASRRAVTDMNFRTLDLNLTGLGLVAAGQERRVERRRQLAH